MNGGIYSQIRFSVSDTSREKQRTLSVFSTIHGSVGVAKARRRYLSLNGKIQGIVITINSKPRKTFFECTLKTRVIIHIAKSRKLSFTAVTMAIIVVNKYRMMRTDMLGDVKNRTYFSKEAKRQAHLISTVSQAFMLSRIVVKSTYYTAIANSIASVIHTKTQTAIIDITIPPGGELRIDSDVFTVTLNGKNIIHTHDGDWIMLDNRLLELVVDTGSGGNLNGQILYNERYL